MTHNVENWTYKTKAEIEALSDAELSELQKALFESIRLFWNAGVKMTDEMFWQFCVVPGICKARGIEYKIL
jgi:hypothetical protein